MVIGQPILKLELVIIIMHRIMLRLQLVLMLLLEPEFVPLLLHQFIEFQFKHLKQLKLIIITVEHQLMLELLLKLKPLIEPEHQLELKLQPVLMLEHLRVKHHLPFQQVWIIITNQVLLTYLHLRHLLRKPKLN